MTEKPGDIPKKDYFRVKNDWWDALIRYRIPGEQRQILDFIIRQTYGWQRKKAVITFTEFEQATGLNRSSVNRALKGLKAKNITGYEKVTSQKIRYWFNKDFKTWTAGYKKVTGYEKVTGTGYEKVTGTGYEKVTGTPIKEITIKEQLNNSYVKNDFVIFWASYPVKKAEKKVEKIWKSLKKKNELPPIETILSAIKDQIKERELQSEIPDKFIPEWKYPAEWLSQGCWTDECNLEKPKTEREKWIERQAARHS